MDTPKVFEYFKYLNDWCQDTSSPKDLPMLTKPNVLINSKNGKNVKLMNRSINQIILEPRSMKSCIKTLQKED